MKLNYAVLSDRGLVRGNNEDSAYAGPWLLALADGMGGHAAGEIASQLMINHLSRLDADVRDQDLLALLASVADDANKAIAQGMVDVPETDGMGTTLTALLFDGTQFGLCHVGDSRAYRLRDGELEQLTVDDTYVQSLVDRGELDPEDISTHPYRSRILKAYTGFPVEPTLISLKAEVGDRLLLCSDGLSDPVTNATIGQNLGVGSPTEAAERLVELALRSGGPDNVTVVVADVVSGDEEGPALPTVPVTAGALRSEEAENPRPDTAAGRAAAALAMRQPQTIPAGNTNTSASSGLSATSPAEGAGSGVAPDSGKSTRRWWIALMSVLVLLILIGGGLYLVRTKMSNNYFVTTQSQAIVIDRGLNLEVFGNPLHHTYQRACMDAAGTLTLVEPEDETCPSFLLADLKESARTQVASLPDGSYDQVQQQLQRLADELLPVCVTRSSESPQPSSTTPIPSDAAGAAEAAAEAASAARKAADEAAAIASSAQALASSMASPGDLTSPGKSCREAR